MKKDEKLIHINISNQFKKILLTLPFLLAFIFLAQIAPVLADGSANGSTEFKGHESREGYYLDGSDFPEGAGDKKGNEATGMIAAILLIAANVTVLLSLILKGVKRFFPLNAAATNSISGFNNAQKKYLRKLHYILNPIAICIAVVHFHLSTCHTILPDLALLLFIVVGGLGIISKYKLSPNSMLKTVYGLHCSSIIFIGLILILAIGHA
jgi:hypothetical protein